MFLLLVALAAAPPNLDTLIQRIHGNDPKARLEAAQAISTGGDSSELVKRLALPPRGSIDTFRRMVLEMWGQVPNWKSGDPMWIRKPSRPGGRRRESKDSRVPPARRRTIPRPSIGWWRSTTSTPAKAAALDPVACIPLEKGQKPYPPDPSPSPSPEPADWETARAEAMEKVALIRAIAASHRLDAVDPIFKQAFELDGVFRDECGRQIRAMDSYAIPSLIRLMHQMGPVAARLGKQRRYAAYQLDRMDRQRPVKAISTAPDDVVRAAIIHAYGEEQALDAVEAILGQVDSPSHRVRTEARWAWLRYVTGKLLSAGAHAQAQARRRQDRGRGRKPDYLTYREIATLALQKLLAEIQGAPVDAKKSAKQLTDELFAYYDARHAAEWDAQLQSGKEKEARGDWQGATDEYGWILAHDPNYDKRAQMTHAFVEAGEALRARGEVSRAVGYYRQAVDLDPAGPEARVAGARVALCDGLESLKSGSGEASRLQLALSLDPALSEARFGAGVAPSRRARATSLATGGRVVGSGVFAAVRAVGVRQAARPGATLSFALSAGCGCRRPRRVPRRRRTAR